MLKTNQSIITMENLRLIYLSISGNPKMFEFNLITISRLFCAINCLEFFEQNMIKNDEFRLNLTLLLCTNYLTY